MTEAHNKSSRPQTLFQFCNLIVSPLVRSVVEPHQQRISILTLTQHCPPPPIHGNSRRVPTESGAGRRFEPYGPMAVGAFDDDATGGNVVLVR